MTARRRLLAATVASAGLVVSCSGPPDDSVASTIAETTTTVAQSVRSDGRLIIGLMTTTGDSVIGEPTHAAFDAAVERINAAGGVLGMPVGVFVSDEGETAASAAEAVQSLLDRNVDAIVGPASSISALNTLDEVVSSGTLACSPTASAMALDNFPDEGLFFRTVPSDSLQAKAIAQAAEQTGAQTATVVYVDDAYGRPFAAAVEAELESGAITVVDSIPFTSGESILTEEVGRVTEAASQVVIVIADGDDGAVFLDALDGNGSDELTTILINDAMRNPTTPQRIQELDADFRGKIVGLAPQAESADADAPFDPPGLFAANAYDCVNLIALAAVKANSDAPREIAGQMAAVSVSGSACETFADCVQTIRDGFEIDYNGPSGVTELQARTGDPSRAAFDRFEFDETGRDVVQRTVVVNL